MRAMWGHRITQLYSIVASVTIPVLLNVDDVNLLVPSALAASVAAIQGINALYKFHENWLNYRTTAETMRREIHFYRAGIDEYADAPDRRPLFVKRAEAIISQEGSAWLIAAGPERGAAS